MQILGLDTSSGKASVAISNGEQIIAYQREVRRGMQAESLLVMLQAALDEAKTTLGRIECLAVTTGPGSFTGVRIGLAAARGLLLAEKIQPIAISNFDLCYFRSARQVEHAEHHVAIINAYRNQCYLQVKSHGEYSEPKLLFKQEVVEFIASLNGLVAVNGSYLQECYNELCALERQSRIILLPRFAEPDAKNLCRTASVKSLQKTPYDSELSPLYVRPPDAKLPKRT